MEFLSKQYQGVLSHSSLNIIRSAISLITPNAIAEDPRMKRFFKGISKERPSRPKYDYTWNPKDVLDYFSTKPHNEKLELKDLSYKLVTLLALVTGHRIQILSLIKITNILISDSKIEIMIPDPIKTSRKGVRQPLLCLLYFKENLKICPASALICYLNATKSIRGPINNLFISINSNVKAVEKQTLSNWVKHVLKSSGIDTTIFSSHSVRHASTSAANRSRLNVNVILQTAGWSENTATFARFYNRELIKDKSEFAMSILNQ